MRISKSKGLVFGLLFLGIVESYLHVDDFLHRFRSVFAAGRAADKISYAESNQPQLLFVGNSRVDNSINPQVISNELGINSNSVFNMGIPGANIFLLKSIFEKATIFSVENKIRSQVFIGLDETIFSSEDNLNYSVFFANRKDLYIDSEYARLLGTIVRLWGYSLNLKGLREPARLKDFLTAVVHEQEAWGGSLAENRGFRGKNKSLINSHYKITATRNNCSPPHMRAVGYFEEFVREIDSRGVQIKVFFPPRLGQRSALEEYRSSCYQGIHNLLKKYRIPIIEIPGSTGYGPELFADPGHLNIEGSKKYSEALSNYIISIKSEEGTAL